MTTMDGTPPTSERRQRMLSLRKESREVLEIIASRLQKENDNIRNVLATDRVFEKGFDYLAGGFNAGLDALEVFSQWISVFRPIRS